jgi:hypothetical protein
VSAEQQACSNRFGKEKTLCLTVAASQNSGRREDRTALSCAVGIGISEPAKSCLRSIAVRISIRLLDRPRKWICCALTWRPLNPSTRPSSPSLSSSLIDSSTSGVRRIVVGRIGVERLELECSVELPASEPSPDGDLLLLNSIWSCNDRSILSRCCLLSSAARTLWTSCFISASSFSRFLTYLEPYEPDVNIKLYARERTRRRKSASRHAHVGLVDVLTQQPVHTHIGAREISTLILERNAIGTSVTLYFTTVACRRLRSHRERAQPVWDSHLTAGRREHVDENPRCAKTHLSCACIGHKPARVASW